MHRCVSSKEPELQIFKHDDILGFCELLTTRAGPGRTGSRVIQQQTRTVNVSYCASFKCSECAAGGGAPVKTLNWLIIFLLHFAVIIVIH